MFNYLKKILFSLLILMIPYVNSISKAMDDNDLDSKHNLSIILKMSSVLDLSSCSVDDDYACKIAEFIKGSPLTQINLNHNHIGNKGIKALAESFKTLKNLTHINLYGNAIDDEGFCELFPALKEVKSLTFMDLRAMKLGTTGAVMLSDLLHCNSRISIYNPILSKDVLDSIFKEVTKK